MCARRAWSNPGRGSPSSPTGDARPGLTLLGSQEQRPDYHPHQEHLASQQSKSPLHTHADTDSQWSTHASSSP